MIKNFVENHSGPYFNLDQKCNLTCDIHLENSRSLMVHYNFKIGPNCIFEQIENGSIDHVITNLGSKVDQNL